MQRVPAAWIAKGLGGWRFPKIPFAEGKKFYILIMTMPAKPPKRIRVNGHMGIFAEDVYGDSGLMAHASSSKGFVAIMISEQWLDKHKGFVLKTH